MKRKKWVAPAWFEPYREFISDDRIEEFMNCDSVNCNLFSNGPRALICCSVSAQVQMLERLQKAGMLPKTGAVK